VFWALPGVQPDYRRRREVIYNGKNNTKLGGAHVFKIPIEELNSLVSAFLKKDFFSLRDRYDHYGATDFPAL